MLHDCAVALVCGRCLTYVILFVAERARLHSLVASTPVLVLALCTCSCREYVLPLGAASPCNTTLVANLTNSDDDAGNDVASAELAILPTCSSLHTAEVGAVQCSTGFIYVDANANDLVNPVSEFDTVCCVSGHCLYRPPAWLGVAHATAAACCSTGSGMCSSLLGLPCL